MSIPVFHVQNENEMEAPENQMVLTERECLKT